MPNNALTTLETVKSFLKITGNSEDTILTLLIGGASDYIEQWTGRRFGKAERTEKYSLSGDSSRFYLRTFPIVSIGSLSVDGGTLTAPGGYVAIDEEGYLSNPSGLWPKGVQNAVITYTGGYVLPKDADEDNPRSLPYDLELATVKLVAAMYNKGQAEGANSSSSGGMSISFDRVFGEDIKALLQNYRYIHV